MSKTRWDRNRAARAQGAWESDYFPLTGGLDRHSSGLTIKPGRLFQCLNMEEVFGYQGYSFIKGYERYDGYVNSPSRATYFVIPFTNGTDAVALPSINATIDNGGSESAKYVTSYVTSGSFAGGDAAGFVVFYNMSIVSTPQWSAGDPIVRSTVGTFATCSEDSYGGSIGFAYHEDALRTLREYFRSQILKPLEIAAGSDNGSGAILGGCIFGGYVWCVRNVTGDATATLFRSSGSGWFEVKTGLHPSAKCRFWAANFTGDPSRLNLYMVNGRDRMMQISSDLVTVTKAPAIFGSEATSTSSVSIGLGTKTFTAAESARGWQVGDAITAWVATDASKYMSGTINAYNSGTGVFSIDVTASGGAGTYDSWEFGKTDYSDKPYLVREHKNHLFLGYPNGQLQTSNLGDPMTYTSTASLFGMGQELTGLSSLKGKSLAVFCERKIDVIEGSSATDWSKEPYASEYGAVLDTVADNDGNPIFLTATGLTTLAATQNFGDLQAKTFSRDVQDIINAKRSQVVGARLALGNAQYRLYFSDGGCLRMTLLTGGESVSQKTVSPAYSLYNAAANCVWQGMMVGGEERMFFGGADGYVYEEDAGTSFDGVAVDYAIRLPFHHYKTPGVEKQFHKLELELQAPDACSIYFRQVFDYDDGTYEPGSGDIDISSPGGMFDVTPIDTAQFDRPTVQRIEEELDGQGRNMALILWASSDFVRPVTLQGVMAYFNKLGVRP